VAYSETVAERLRAAFADRPGVTEKRMFGGVAFLDRGNLCCGVVGERLMARVGPEGYDDALARPHAREMDFTGRPLRGMVYVDPPGFAADGDLRGWLDLCLAFTTELPEK